jgi:peptidoglycan/xylan/chitin deacetylase (PgdA/CDA1 family)
MRILAHALVVILVVAAQADAAAMAGDRPARRMAVTIDDLPVSQPSWHTPEQMDAITDDLLGVLSDHGVTAVGFVNEGKLLVDGVVDPGRVAQLERWLDAGMELGNHGFAHLDLHRVTTKEWLADVERGEGVLRPLVEGRGGSLRHFRHPYLHTGRSVAVQRTTQTWLAEHGYRIAAVTLDNSEWIYGRAYAAAFNRGDEDLMERIGASYVDYMMDVVRFYEGQSEQIVGRPIDHVLLIHAYALNADHLDTLLTRLEHEGWSFVTLEEALEDPVYRRPTHGYTGSGGITWLHRWAITANLDRAVFAGEPEIPGWINDLADAPLQY